MKRALKAILAAAALTVCAGCTGYAGHADKTELIEISPVSETSAAKPQTAEETTAKTEISAEPQTEEETAAKTEAAVYDSIDDIYKAGADIIYDRRDDRPDLIKTIDGNYSSFAIYSEDDALRSVEQIKKLIGITEPSEELVFERVTTAPDGETVYDFSQQYKGIPVKNGGVRIITDKTGYPVWFTADIIPDLSLETIEPALSREQLCKLAGRDVDEIDADSAELCIYAGESTGYKPVLAMSVRVWKMTPIWNDPDRKMLIDYDHTVSTDTGELLFENPLTIVD